MLTIVNLNYNGGNMKKIMGILLLILCAATLTAQTKKVEQSVLVDCISDPSHSIPLKYIRSLLAGGLIGVGTGILSAYFDSLASQFWPITWFVAMNTRCDLLSSIGNDMGQHNVPYHNGLMRLSSLVAAWVSWYRSFYYLTGRSPFNS